MLNQPASTMLEPFVAMKAKAAARELEKWQMSSGRSSCAVDLISAIVAHAEAVPRWFGLAGRREPEIQALARQVVCEALRVHECLKERERRVADECLNSARSGHIELLRGAADRLLDRLCGAGEDEPGVQDARCIASNVHRLSAMMASDARPWPQRDARCTAGGQPAPDLIAGRHRSMAIAKGLGGVGGSRSDELNLRMMALPPPPS